MSEDLHNNERYLKEAADKHKPVPPPFVWDEIAQVLDKDKRKRRFYPILWVLGVLVMGTTLFISFKVKKDKESLIVEREIIISDDQKQPDPILQEIRSVDSEVINEGKKDKESLIVERETIISDDQKQPDPILQEIRLADSEAINEGKKDKESLIVERETIISDDQKQRDPNLQDVRSVDSEAINEGKKGQNANFSETTLAVSDNQEGKKVDSEKLKSFATHQHQLSNFNTSGLDSSLNANTINSNATAVLAKEDLFTPRMSTQSTFEDRKVIPVTPVQSPKWIPRLIVPVPRILLPDSSENLPAFHVSEPKDNASPSSPWFVELRGGFGKNLSNPVLVDGTQGGYRLNTESRWYSWSASMQLGYQLDDHWYTTVGFDLNQTKHRFDFWRRGISGLIASENQSFQITNSDFFNIGEVSYTFADIGLSLGRRVNIDKWHFSLEGGPIFNLSFNANGKVQVGGLEFSRLEDQEAYFNPQIGMGARFSAMLDHPISDQLWVSVGPSYYQYFNTVSADENPLRERNSIIQVMAKVRCHF